MNQEIKEKIKQYLKFIVHLSLSIAEILGILMISLFLPLLTLTKIIEYFIILGVLIVAEIYINHKENQKSNF